MSDTKAAHEPRGGKSGKDTGHSTRTDPVTFLRQVIAELRKVVWPTQQQLITYFIVVMVFVVVLMTLISVLDLAFGKLVFEIFTGGSDL